MVQSQAAEAAGPRWEDALEPAPELVVVVRPQALRSDKLYGPLLRRLIALARERSSIVAATRALDVVETADEVIVGLRGLREAGGDLVAVVRGVRADLDPAMLVDENGQPLWSPGPAGAARELVHVRADASLFELSGRTWVIATGGARRRVREAFGCRGKCWKPTQPPWSDTLVANEPDPIAIARLNGPALVSRFHALRPPGLLAPLGRRLETVELVLSAGREADDAAVEATLSYGDEAAASSAEAAIGEAIHAFLGAKSEYYGWLRAAVIKRSRSTVTVTTPLPQSQNMP
jgi:hypothetical protein